MQKRPYKHMTDDEFQLIKLLQRTGKKFTEIQKITGRGNRVQSVCEEANTFLEYVEIMKRRGIEARKQAELREQKRLESEDGATSVEEFKESVDAVFGVDTNEQSEPLDENEKTDTENLKPRSNDQLDYLINALNRNTEAVEKLTIILSNKKGWKRAFTAIGGIDADDQN